MKARTVDPSTIRVAKAVAGAVLASPMRRFLAYAADWALIVPISFGLLLLLITASIGHSDPEALAGLKTLALVSNDSVAVQREALVKVLPLLVRKEAAELPHPVQEAVERGEVETAAAKLDGNSVLLVYNLGHAQHVVNPGERRIRIQIEVAKLHALGSGATQQSEQRLNLTQPIGEMAAVV